MMIRPRFHWLVLSNGIFLFASGLGIILFKTDHFMAAVDIAAGAVLFGLWSSTFSIFSDESIDRTQVFFKRTILLKDIVAVEPHRYDGSWGNGRVVVIVERSGRRSNFQPAQPQMFLDRLRQRLPNEVPVPA